MKYLLSCWVYVQDSYYHRLYVPDKVLPSLIDIHSFETKLISLLMYISLTEAMNPDMSGRRRESERNKREREQRAKGELSISDDKLLLSTAKFLSFCLTSWHEEAAENGKGKSIKGWSLTLFMCHSAKPDTQKHTSRDTFLYGTCLLLPIA